MESPPTSALYEVADYRSEICLSLYLAGTQPVHRWIGRALAQFRQDLERRGVPLGEAGPLVAQVIQDAAQGAPPCSVPPQRSEAIFWSPGFFRRLSVDAQLTQRVMVGGRFHLDPALYEVSGASRFHVLALTTHTARLYQGDRSQLQHVWFPVPCEPAAGASAKLARAASKLPWWPGSHSGSADAAPCVPRLTHSAAGATGILEFFRQVDRSIRRMLHGQTSPLLLACVGYLASLYRSANTYPNLVACKIPGCPDRWSLSELQRNAWRLVAPYLSDASPPLGGAAEEREGRADGCRAERVEVAFEYPAPRASAPSIALPDGGQRPLPTSLSPLVR